MNCSPKYNIISTLPPNVMACFVDKLSLQSAARLSVTCKEINIGTIKGFQRLRLIKREFVSELDEAFASRKPITLKRHYFSFEARKRTHFNIKNKDTESLRKIKLSGNINLLLKKKIIEQEDLEFLFDEDLKVLEFLLDKSQNFCVKVFDQIPDAEDASYICRYIIKNKLSVSEALDLTFTEVANLANTYICYSVITNELDIDRVKNLSAWEFSILCDNKILYLIETWQLTVARALEVSMDEFSRLSNNFIYRIVVRGELPFEEIKNLTVDQVANAVKIGVLGCSYFEPDATFRVLRALGMSVGDILAIDYGQIVRLSSYHIHKLLRHKKLSIEKALCLTESQMDLLNNRPLCKLFFASKLSLEEAERLSDYEREVLNCSGICKLIARGKVKLEDAVNPDCEEAMYKLCQLWEFICEDKVSVDFVKGLSEAQLQVFESEWIYRLVREGLLSVEDAVNLPEDAFDNLNNERIYNLIINGKLDIEEAMDLSVDLYDILSFTFISRAICQGRLSLEDAKALSPPDIDGDVKQGSASEGGWWSRHGCVENEVPCVRLWRV